MKVDVIDKHYDVELINEPFSVCMTVLNESSTIIAFLSTLMRAQLLQPCEVVIVDGGSTDDTCDKIEEFDDCRINLIKASGSSIAVGRNVASRAASYDIHVTVDAGTLLDPLFLVNLLGPMYDLIDAPDLTAGIYLAIKSTIWSKYFIPSWRDIDNLVNRFLPSCRCSAFRRSLFDEVGGFEENTKQKWGEDTLFMLKAKQASEHWVINRAARVHWHAPTNLEEAKRLAYCYGMGNGEIGYDVKPPVTKDPIMLAVLEGFIKGQQLRAMR